MPYLARMIHIVLLALLLVSTAAGASEFSLNIADIVSPAFSARGIRLILPVDGSADLHISKLHVQQREFLDVRVRCAGFSLSSVQVACRKGRLDALPDAKLDFSYGFDSKQLQLALIAPGGESWQVTGQMGERVWQVSVQMHNAQAKRLTALLPADVAAALSADSLRQAGGSESVSLREIHFNQGMLNGTVHANGDASGMDAVKVDVQLVDVGFSDAAGLHAAEKLRGGIGFSAKRNGTVWNWQGNVAWHLGELFWKPLYLHGGQALSASGRFDGKLLGIEQAVLDLLEVGRVKFTANWDIQQSALQDGTLRGENLKLSSLFEIYAKPFLDKGVLAESALSGHADVEGHYRSGELQSLTLGLHDAGIADAAQRFAMRGVNSEIAWRADAPSSAAIAFACGTLLGATIGAGQWQVNMDGLRFDVPEASLSVLDGRLELRNFHLHQATNQTGKPVWHWQFEGALGPIRMEQLSQAAGLPVMLGTLAGRIPRVSYDGNEINVDGALLFNVFDGTVVATGMKLADAFGRAPVLSGNLTMRNLDLDLLTRTFSFGNMQGRLDVDVNNLQLQNWQPVRFEARLYSSAGNYPKKISQKAVQNISSLGGAGAAAAIQRSYLSFFENFGYDRIGWSCVLRNGVCAMGGIEGGNQGMYEIIRGGGIPAISVMGYNRAVSWGELITRLKRVTQSNVKPIVN